MRKEGETIELSISNMVEQVTDKDSGGKPKGSVRVCIRVRPQLNREVVYRQVVEAVSVSELNNRTHTRKKDVSLYVVTFKSSILWASVYCWHLANFFHCFFLCAGQSGSSS